MVDHIGFGRQMINVHLSGVKIFQAKSSDVLRELSKIDPSQRVHEFNCFYEAGDFPAGLTSKMTIRRWLYLFVANGILSSQE